MDEEELRQMHERMEAISKKFRESMKARPFYRVIDEGVLSNIEDAELETALFDIIWAIRVNSHQDRISLMQETFNAAYSLVFSTIQLETQVSNGGFNQFFFNGTHHYTSLALDGYNTFGLSNIVKIVNRAQALYQSELEDEAKAELLASQTIEGFMESYKLSNLKQLDRQMWNSADQISKARVDYIRKNSVKFYGDFRHWYESK